MGSWLKNPGLKCPLTIERSHFNLVLFNRRLFNLMVQKFMVEKSEVERLGLRLMHGVEKSMVEMSFNLLSVWKVQLTILSDLRGNKDCHFMIN